MIALTYYLKDFLGHASGRRDPSSLEKTLSKEREAGVLERPRWPELVGQSTRKEKDAQRTSSFAEVPPRVFRYVSAHAFGTGKLTT